VEEPRQLVGQVAFDVGLASIGGLETDTWDYDTGSPVVVEMQAFAVHPISATLELTLDSGHTQSETVSLPAGLTVLTRTVPAGVLQVGHRALTATLALDGQVSVGDAFFDYGVDAADLAVSAPWRQLTSPLEASVFEVLVMNRGGQDAPATSVELTLGSVYDNVLLGTATAPALAAGESATIQFGWDATVYAGQTITVGAIIDRDETVVEFRRTDNRAYRILTLPEATADLEIILSAAPDPVQVNETLTYQAAISNLGPATATGVSLTDLLPPAVDFVSASASQGSGCQEDGGTVTCDLGALAPGADATVTLRIVPTMPGMLVNQMWLSAPQVDPRSANDLASQETVVLGVIPADGKKIYLPLVIR
jgi:uncharacterized repeat protein (TIGR01451 family)